MLSWNVPCRPGTVPWLRGTISYQAPERASGGRRRSNHGAACNVGAGLVLRHGGGERLGEQKLGIAALVEATACLRNDLLRLFSRPDGFEQGAALLRLQPHILAGIALEQEIAAPGRECVGPRLDCVAEAARLRRDEAAGPAVVFNEAHRRALPFELAIATPQQRGRDDLVTVAEDIRPDSSMGSPATRFTAKRPPSTLAYTLVDEVPTTRKVCNRRSIHSTAL